MNSDGLKFVLQEFANRQLPQGQDREQELPTDTGKVIGLCGVRRSGKTFLFFQAMRRLLARGVHRHRILYLNFEDDRLHPIKATELDLVLRCQRELFEAARTESVYLFLDEVQSAPGWERWVRRLHDTENISIFVTGSSSARLTRDLSTALRGRSVTLDVFPLSFREFLRFRGIEIRQHDVPSETAARAALVEYLHWGSFPEVVVAAREMRPLILDEYASLMLWRDLVERNRIRNESVMRSVLRHCFRSTASLISLSKLHRDLGSQGLTVGKKTLFDYVAMLQDAGLIHLLPVHGDSPAKAARNPRKLHVVDPGLVTAFKAGGDRDVGHKLETVVYLHARRAATEWHYLPGAGETDLCDPEGKSFVNSCWRLVEEATIQREEQAISAARAALGRVKGALVYHDAPVDIQSRIPEAIPAWQWLLAQPVRGMPAPPPISP